MRPIVAGCGVASHTHGAEAVKQAIRRASTASSTAFLIDDEAIQMLVDNDTFLVPTTRLATRWTPRTPPELQTKAAEMFPRGMFGEEGLRRRGQDRCRHRRAGHPARQNADELVAPVSRGMSNAAVLRAATVVAAELIQVTDRGRLAEGLLADIIAVPGNPWTT